MLRHIQRMLSVRMTFGETSFQTDIQHEIHSFFWSSLTFR